MVQLVVKLADEDQFIFCAALDARTADVTQQIATIYNARLKIRRMCYHMEDLARHGITLPPNMQGLLPDQMVDFKLTDEWADKCVPSGGWVSYPDEQCAKRNGRAPNEKMQEMMKETMEKAKELISKTLVKQNTPLTLKNVQEAYNLLKGAVIIVYPMGIPPHDPLHFELTRFEIGHTDDPIDRKDIIDPNDAALWFHSKLMLPSQDRLLRDYLGTNEKCKVIVKITRKSSGAPTREDVMSDEQKQKVMHLAFLRQEELKKLQTDDDDSYMNSAWANPSDLKQSLHGLSDIKTRWTAPSS